MGWLICFSFPGQFTEPYLFSLQPSRYNSLRGGGGGGGGAFKIQETSNFDSALVRLSLLGG